MTNPVKTPKTISEVIAEHAHDPEGTSGGGILASCICKEAYDWMPDHLQAHILKECFPHLSEVHEDLIRKEPSIFLTKRYYVKHFHASENLLEAIWDFVEEHSKRPHPSTEDIKGKLWHKGVRDTAKKLKKLLIEHDL